MSFELFIMRFDALHWAFQLPPRSDRCEGEWSIAKGTNGGSEPLTDAWRRNPTFALILREETRLNLVLWQDEPRVAGLSNRFAPIGFEVYRIATKEPSEAECRTTHSSVECDKGHRMVPNQEVVGKSFPALRMYGECDKCNTRGCTHRCGSGCDYDLCQACYNATQQDVGNEWIRMAQTKLVAARQVTLDDATTLPEGTYRVVPSMHTPDTEATFALDLHVLSGSGAELRL